MKESRPHVEVKLKRETDLRPSIKTSPYGRKPNPRELVPDVVLKAVTKGHTREERLLTLIAALLVQSRPDARLSDALIQVQQFLADGEDH